MKFENVSGLFKVAKTWSSKHAPELLTGVGIGLSITTTVLAVKATPKAMKLVDKAIEEKGEKLTPVETVKAGWKPYIPAAVTMVASASCLICSNKVNAKRLTAMATAYQLSTTALNEYKETVAETVGIEKAKEIKDKVIEKKLDKAEEPKRETTNAYFDEAEELFYDEAFDTLFYSTKNKIEAARNQLNNNMLNWQYASLNDFYNLLNVKSIGMGESLGWNLGRDGMLEISIDRVERQHGKLCNVLEYHVAPKYDYHKELI